MINKFFKNKYALVFLFCVFFGVILANVVSYHACWDFMSYHYYNGWAFANNRLNTDILPAMFRTYFNPLTNFITYVLIERLNNHPIIFLSLSGINYGLFMFLAYLFFDSSLLVKNTEKSFLITVCLLLTFFSAIFLTSITFTSNDVIYGIMTLLAGIICFENIFKSETLKRNLLLTFCGLLIGAVIGLKYSSFAFCIGIFSIIVFRYKMIEKPLKCAFLLFAGVLIGFIITNGWWMYLLYKYFQNPIFPYFNNIFQSPLCDINTIWGSEFQHLRPHSVMDFIFAPIKNPIFGQIGNELSYFDIKISLTFISCIMYFVFIKTKLINISDLEIVDANKFNSYIIFVIAVYYSNCILFGNIRYIISIIPFCVLIIVAVCYLGHKILKTENNNSLFYFLVLFSPLILYHSFLRNMGAIGLLAIITVVSCIILIAYISLKWDNLSNFKKSFFQFLLVILSITAVTTRNYFFFFSPETLFNLNKNKIVDIQNIYIKDNSLVILGTMTANFIIPFQNPNAKYVGMPISEELSEKGFWYNIFRNMYFVDGTFGNNTLKDLYYKHDDVYFIYAQGTLGNKERDLKIYLSALNKYTDNNFTRLHNCRSAYYYILNEYIPHDEIIVCKIK